METVLTRSPIEAAEFIKLGGIVAFPTETVYGLGADVFNSGAIAKIFEAKRRPSDNPLIAHIGDLAQIELLTSTIPPNARKFIESFFPGPLTIVLPKSSGVPLIATAGHKTIGVRMPKNDLAQFLKACGTPVVAPSANISGRPSPTTSEAVLQDLSGRIDCILEGGSTEIGLESTVIDCTSDIPMLLRPGSVSLSRLQIVVPEIRSYSGVKEETPRSPGLKHKHYSPNANIVLVDASKKFETNVGTAAFIGIGKQEGSFEITKICNSAEDYARSLFAFFRECDALGIATIYCQIVEEVGIGTALMDRLRRAAGG